MSETVKYISIFTGDPLPSVHRRQMSEVDADFAATVARQWAIDENLDGNGDRVFTRYTVTGYRDNNPLPEVLRAGEVAQ